MQITYSLSFTIATDAATRPAVEARLDEGHLAGRIKDEIAQALAGLPFDLAERYVLVQVEQPEPERPRRMETIPIWSAEQGCFIEVAIGSAEWFALIEAEGKFSYRYEGLTFTVRYEARKSRGKVYHYWRAYATVGGKLRAKQIGKTADLTAEALAGVGAYFVGLTA